MVDLDFTVEGVEVEPHAVSPLLLFALQAYQQHARGGRAQRAAQLPDPRSSRRGAATAPASRTGLSDLFGAPQRWGETLRSFLWTHANICARFETECTFKLPVRAASISTSRRRNTFHGVDSGEVPL